jgi:peptidoglycan/xylan/chitin deacetylase (PgdA/CDA1 family)
MRAVSLLYHDVIDPGDYTSSGFSIPGANRYKLERQEFEMHLGAIAQVSRRKPACVLDFLRGGSSGTDQASPPFFMTFDDGGSSAWPCIASLLELLGWKGHFLITAGYIGARAFLGKDEIRTLRKSGHIVGSHSTSHPERMSACGWQELVREWDMSVKTLSDILGEGVTVASVPGGYYSRRVAEAAATAGIKALFNSEPTTKCRWVDGCLVLGRYSMQRGMPPRVAAGLAAGYVRPRLKLWTWWNVKGLGKSVGGDTWLRMRRMLLRGK